MIISALDAKQSPYKTQMDMAMQNNRQQADQHLAQLLRESVKAGRTVINKSGSGGPDLNVYHFLS
ncbi:MAG: hypothetical protein C0407_04980 [Desulfobacca sp.]|nr:hypothetical protein [Desulfobacca sp.]